MTNTPQPKAEMLIELDGNLIIIHTASADAATWMDQEGPRYGFYQRVRPLEAHLRVSPLYDRAEVVAYLSSYASLAEIDTALTALAREYEDS